MSEPSVRARRSRLAGGRFRPDSAARDRCRPARCQDDPTGAGSQDPAEVHPDANLHAARRRDRDRRGRRRRCPCVLQWRPEHGCATDAGPHDPGDADAVAALGRSSRSRSPCVRRGGRARRSYRARGLGRRPIQHRQGTGARAAGRHERHVPTANVGLRGSVRARAQRGFHWPDGRRPGCSIGRPAHRDGRHADRHDDQRFQRQACVLRRRYRGDRLRDGHLRAGLVRSRAENGQRQDLWILDVAGTRLVIDATTFPETSAGDRAEMQAIVDTLLIEPTD